MRGIGAFPGSREPRLVEHADPPAPRRGEVLCETVALGVCGTDRDILESAAPLIPAGADHLVLGHECLGRIIAVGADVTGWRPGDLVVPVVRRARDRSHPRADLLPFGTYHERGIVEQHGFSLPRWLDEPQYLYRVDPEIADVAVLTEPLSVAEKGIHEAIALQRGRLGPDTWTTTPPRVLVTGQGPIAFTSLLACRCRRWPVTVLGRDDESTFRSRLAASLGARYVPAHRFPTPPDDFERDGYDLILECTGDDGVLLRAAQSLAACGIMVWQGSSRRPQSRENNLDLLMRNAVLRNHVHVGTVNAAGRDFQAALDHLAQLRRSDADSLRSLLTHQVPFRESLWHYRHRAPQGIKTVVVPD